MGSGPKTQVHRHLPPWLGSPWSTCPSSCRLRGQEKGAFCTSQKVPSGLATVYVVLVSGWGGSLSDPPREESGLKEDERLSESPQVMRD